MSTTGEVQQTTDAAAKDLHEYLILLIKQAAAAYPPQEQLNFHVEQLPMDLRFSAQASIGDYSMPVMAWAGQQMLGRPPLLLAEPLAAILRGMSVPLNQEITVTKPGY